MRKYSGGDTNGFDNHAQAAKIKYNTEGDWYKEEFFELASEEAEIISYAYANDGTRLASRHDSKTSVACNDYRDRRNDQHNPPNHFKSNDEINLISIQVALIDKKTLDDRADKNYKEYTVPRLKDIKTLKDSVPYRHGEFDTAKCFNDWSINQFISHTFLPIHSTINNIDGLINLLTEEDVALGVDGVSGGAAQDL